MPALPPFQQLLDRHAHDVLGYLTAMLGPVEAEDAFQETFLAALRAYPGLRDGRNLRGWLFTIAHRKALDSRRLGRRKPTPSGLPSELAESAAAIAGASRDAPNSGVDRADPRAAADLSHDDSDLGTHFSQGTADGDLDAEALWAAVDALPLKQRAAVTLRFTADLSHREIAAAIECSEAAARRNLHEGLSKLREVWT